MDTMDGTMDGAEGLLDIDLLNLQLGLVDRDFDESDYEVRPTFSLCLRHLLVHIWSLPCSHGLSAS